jgi:hypothetical protein
MRTHETRIEPFPCYTARIEVAIPFITARSVLVNIEVRVRDFVFESRHGSISVEEIPQFVNTVCYDKAVYVEARS